jgi:hypothetical protein
MVSGGVSKRRSAAPKAPAGAAAKAKASGRAAVSRSAHAAAGTAAGMLSAFASRKPRANGSPAAAAAPPGGKLALRAPPTPPTPPALLPPLPLAADAPLPPFPPLPLPKSVGEADAVVGHLGAEYVIRDAGEWGRGLFVAAPLRKGALIARYDGVLHTTRTLPPGAPRTHMLRLKDSDFVLDGRPLADGLLRGRDGAWRPANDGDARMGYASLANSSMDTAKSPNARMVFRLDYGVAATAPVGGDGAARPSGALAPAARRPNHALASLLPQGAFLVANKDLAPGAEVLWHYQVSHK